MAAEAEGILLMALRQVGVAIPEDVTSFQHFSADLLVRSVSRCLELLEVCEATSLPRGIAARHRVCTQLATQLKQAGYGGDCGYNTLLYPTAASTQRIVAFLVERLPRPAEEAAEEALGADAVRSRRILQALDSWRRQPWLLPMASSRRLKRRFRSVDLDLSTGTGVALPQQVTAPADYVCSLLDKAARLQTAAADLEEALTTADLGARDSPVGAKAELEGGERPIGGQGQATPAEGTPRRAEGGRFANAARFGQDSPRVMVLNDDERDASRKLEQDASAEEKEALKQQREAILVALKQQIVDTQRELAETEAKSADLKTQLQQMEEEVGKEGSRAEALEREYAVKKKTLDMLPNATENIRKLEGLVDLSRQRLRDLEAEWEEYRTPLVDEIQQLQDRRGRRRERCREMLDEMKRYKAEMQQMAGELKDKEERAKLLADEYEAMPKNVNRTLYTYRIMDIIQSIAKQKKQVKSIVADIREVQRSINTISERLTRAEVLVDEKIFQSAQASKREEAQVASYRKLQQLKATFEKLIESTTSIGRKEGEARDLEGLKEALQSRISQQNSDRIKRDLQLVREENKALREKIKSMA